MTGLRERKKQETRAALSWAAVRLAVQHGFDNVLVEDIAAEAGVSPRTFNNYFASKAEATCARHRDRGEAVADALRARPGEEPLWDAIAAAFLTQAGDDDHVPDPEWTAGVRVMIDEPGLLGEMLKAGAAAQDALTEAVAERTGTDTARDLYPTLVAGAAGVAWQTVTTRWAHTDPPVPLAPLLRDALAQLAAGLPEPA